MSTDRDESLKTVLAAEAQARAAVSRCETKARQRVADAREQARRIAARADERIGRFHLLCADANRRRIGELEQNAGAPPAPAGDGAAIARAVERLAEELIGKDLVKAERPEDTA